MSRFWPPAEPAQLEYERLRETALAGALLIGGEGERFQRGGLPALIRKPAAPDPRLVVGLVEVPRPRWSPYQDPRLEALADAYDLLTAAVPDLDLVLEVAR